MSRQRIGHFNVPRRLVLDDPKLAAKVYAGLIPVRVELHFGSDAFDVVAIGLPFDELEDGQLIPHYDLNGTRDGDEVTINFNRRGGFNGSH